MGYLLRKKKFFTALCVVLILSLANLIVPLPFWQLEKAMAATENASPQTNLTNYIDTITPSVNITSPATGTRTSPSGSIVTVTADATDNVGVTKVEFYVDNVLAGVSTTVPYNYNWTTTAGSHIITAKAYDAAGNVGASSDVILIVPANVTVTSPVEGSTVRGMVTSFSATSSDPLVGWSALYIDGSLASSLYLATPVSSLNINYNWDTNTYASGTRHTIEIAGDTVNGKVASVGKSIVTVDNNDYETPLVNITSPATGTRTSPSGSIVTVTADATDNVGVTKVEFYVDNVLAGVSTTVPYNYNWTTTAGSHIISAKAYDAAGNVGASSDVILIVPADVTVTSPVEGSTVKGMVTSFSATSSDPLVGWSALYIDGSLASSLYLAAPVSSLNINYNWDTSTYASGTRHTIEIAGDTDNGKVASVGKSIVTVDNNDYEAPIVNITSPSTDTKNSPINGTITITANATDNVGVTKVEFYVDNVLVGVSTTAPYSYNWAPKAGNHTLSAKAYDAAGNVGTSCDISIKVNFGKRPLWVIEKKSFKLNLQEK